MIKASKILNFEIAAEYLKRIGDKMVQEPLSTYQHQVEKISVNLKITGQIPNYEHFNELLREIKETASTFGFEIE